MSSLVSYHTRIFKTVTSLQPILQTTIDANPCAFNVIVGNFQSIPAMERDGHSPSRQLFITVGPNNHKIDLLLACITLEMGDLPVFIASPHNAATLTSSFLEPRMGPLVDALFENVLSDRVFAIFALGMVSRTFANAWCKRSGVQPAFPLYYEAKLTFCTTTSLITFEERGGDCELRKAVPPDIPLIADLFCKFSETSKPYILSSERALQEAKSSVAQGQVWVCFTRTPDSTTPTLACVVAATRDYAPVTAITKVYTSDAFRGRGYAKRLVHYVTEHLLQNRERIVLYVGCDKADAIQVYHRVGYLGLDSKNPPVEGVDTWIEMGFMRHGQAVKLGHW